MTAPVIMWFRQDLRLADNPALAAAAVAGPVLPLFILDDEAPGRWRWGGASRWWLRRSLDDLGRRLPLRIEKGRTEEVLERVITESGAQGLYFSRGYAPWEGALEGRVKALCDRLGIACRRFGGFLLHEPEAIRTGTGGPYRVYTPFSRACFALGDPRSPNRQPEMTIMGSSSSISIDEILPYPMRPNWAAGFDAFWTPGEEGARDRLNTFLENDLADYADRRDEPARAAISRLSPHLHWGEISPHQVWHAAKAAMERSNGRLDRSGQKFLSEVLWREFAHHLLHHLPSFPEKPYRVEFEEFPWRDDPELLRAWQTGRTGYPIVDAGMRELWATGFMHNRVRMIVASFLVKHLLIPWQEGEAWFWDTLVDADIANNAASWQWVAGCGADAAPYFRIFNPNLQGRKFDPDGTYVRRWVPELRSLPVEHIHAPWEAPAPLRPAPYPGPIVDHGKARDRALAAYQQIKSAAT